MVGVTTSNPQFDKAAVEVKKLTKKPADEEKLKLYSLFKIATEADFKAAQVPSIYQFEARYKYKAWKELVDQGMKPAEAQAKYIAFVEELKPKYHYDPNKVPE